MPTPLGMILGNLADPLRAMATPVGRPREVLHELKVRAIRRPTGTRLHAIAPQARQQELGIKCSLRRALNAQLCGLDAARHPA
jgi:hypothetical protein